MFKVGDKVIHPKGIFGAVALDCSGEVLVTGNTRVRVLFGKGSLAAIVTVDHADLELDPMFGWITYGKSYKDLRDEMEVRGESLVGVQVDLEECEPRHRFRGGIYLVGHLELGGDVSGEYYATVEHQIVIRYRRLLTAEQLEE
jgi:hypothetical protein